MPKMKSHRGASKRFKKTKTGKIKRRRAYKGHLLTKKSPKRKRNLRKPGFVFKGEAKKIAQILAK